MKRSKFGEPRPANADEIVEMLADAGLDASDVYAEISSDVWDPEANGFDGINMTGYTAEIRNSDEGDELGTTIGFEQRADLIQILHAAGITEIETLG
ncbi:hypothetical protein [Shinella zoogloeoides]|uniref:hypothetical protein n=1 Tax=Shinella zoogloeoides TaxID=352475 RepID=UPI00273E331F|nr:hypothetical protein [Shinella zoogloeoides]WLR90915.1 hypothetical protein Q9316_00630 [Shinella zoogloeoides]